MSQNWKFKYIVWYRLLESIFGNQVPHLTEEEIVRFVSENDWMIIPLLGETDKEKAKLAQRPNLYIDLSNKDLINFGIVYEKLESIERFRDIVTPYNERERKEIIERLSTLDDGFLTTVSRKIKMHH